MDSATLEADALRKFWDVVRGDYLTNEVGMTIDVARQNKTAEDPADVIPLPDPPIKSFSERYANASKKHDLLKLGFASEMRGFEESGGQGEFLDYLIRLYPKLQEAVNFANDVTRECNGLVTKDPGKAMERYQEIKRGLIKMDVSYDPEALREFDRMRLKVRTPGGSADKR